MMHAQTTLTANFGEGLSCLPASWECDLGNDRLTWAPGVFDIFGLSRHVRPKRGDIVAQYAPESREELEFLRRRAIAEGGSFTFEAYIHRRIDSERRRIRIVADTVKRAGKVVLLYGQKQDITDESFGLSG